MNWRLMFWIIVSAFVAALVAVAALLLSGDKFSVSLRTLTVSGGAATYTVELDVTAEWVLLASPGDWCQVDPYMGSKGQSKVTVAVTANPHQEAREAKLIFYSGNTAKEVLLKQLPEHQRAVTVTPRPVEQVRPVAATPVKPTVQARAVPVTKPVPVAKKAQPQPKTVAKSRPVAKATPAPAVKSVPAKQETPASGKIIIQPDVLRIESAKEESVKEEPVRKEPVKPMQSAAAPPCTPAELFLLTSSSEFICAGRSVEFYLSGSQPSISYQLFRNGQPVSGFVPGKGAALTFPDSYTEGGVYTVKSVAVARYCATAMQGSIKITAAKKFDPGKIVSYTETVNRGALPLPIKSEVPASGGDGKIRYQWCINGRFIKGANSETYQPAEVDYSCTYTRMAHDESCNIPWEAAAGEAVVVEKR